MCRLFDSLSSYVKLLLVLYTQMLKSLGNLNNKLNVIALRNKSLSIKMSSKKDKKKKSIPSEEDNQLQPITKDKNGNLLIKFLAKPGAKQNGITDINEDGIGIQIQAPPVEGEANTELIKFLSKLLNVRKSDLQLNKGSKSRQKIIEIDKDCKLSIESVLKCFQNEIGK